MTSFREGGGKGFHLRIDPELLQWCDEQAAERGVSRAKFFEWMVTRIKIAVEGGQP